MNASITEIDTIFCAAIELSSPEERAGYVAQACGGNAAVRQRVDELLAAHFGAGDFLERPPVTELLGECESIQEGPGAVIGPYKLLEQIGEGGMGVVFLAEQERPVRRNVALKIIKPGMDTRQVIARFEAERQALALMDHPNIAKVLDAGTTGGSRDKGQGTRARSDSVLALDSRPSTLDYPGRPYFVMELVKGVPVTKYCDEKQLSLRERLSLFLPVCYAVQHAHQKGLIHRDLKPSNVPVAEYDGQAVPKVIDFGVAKATAQRLTEQTTFTAFGQVIGTVEYMSPEQAQFNQLDIDTRSDIYSLGVLLYELLTGGTPFDKSRLETTPFDETLRIIREEEPPCPSSRLSTIASLPAVASNRQTEPIRLKKEIRCELDWIVMKALEKDRNRRYETVSALASDLVHYLADEPVSAAAPSRLYLARKFVRRNRRPVVAAALITVATLVGAAVSTWQAVRATRAERSAVANAEQARASAAAERAAKEQEAAQRRKSEDITNFLISAFNFRYPEHDIESVTEVLKKSEQELQKLYSDNPVMLATTGRAYSGLRQFGEAERMYRRCLEIADDPGLIERARLELATCLIRQGKSDEAIPMLEDLYLQELRLANTAAADELLTAWSGLRDATSSGDEKLAVDGLELDGDGDYVVVPRVFFDGRPPWTLEAIVWPAEVDSSNPADSPPTGWTSLVSAANGGSIGLESLRQRWTIEMYTAAIRNPVWTDNYASASARVEVPLGTWQHVAGLWDGNELRLYLDGQLQATRPGVDYCSTLSLSPMFLGADPSNVAATGDVAEGFLRGRLRAARISRAVEYTGSFPATQRLEKTPGTIGLYDFTIDNGRYAIDRSGHGNHGIIIGARYAKNVSSD